MIRGLIVVFLVLLVMSGCGKEEEVIPNVSFSGQIYIPGLFENPTIFQFDVNHYRLGINGIVIYRVSPDVFYAFDLMCPYEKSLDCLVEITDGAICTCPCCNSQFIIVMDPGSVVQGPARWPLKSYRTDVNGDYLYVSN
jgi:nitrite reductase/ring-hydroxylating ferredoxin subunit